MQVTISPAKLEAARAALALRNINLVGDSGEVTHEGVTLDFTYSNQVLTITTKKKPFWMPEASIESEIMKWFGQV